MMMFFRVQLPNTVKNNKKAKFGVTLTEDNCIEKDYTVRKIVPHFRPREAGPPSCPARGLVPCRPPLPGSPSSSPPREKSTHPS